MSAPHRASRRKAPPVESVPGKDAPSSAEVMAGKPIKPKRDYPVAKGFEPPPDPPESDSKEAPGPEAKAGSGDEADRRRRRVVIAALAFGLLFVVSLAVLGGMLLSGGRIDKDGA